MEEAKIKLTEEEKKSIEYIWKKVVKRTVKQETLETLEWNDIEDFTSDVFRLGMDVASEDPMSFIKNRILEKYPILKEDVREEEIKGNFERIYG